MRLAVSIIGVGVVIASVTRFPAALPLAMAGALVVAGGNWREDRSALPWLSAIAGVSSVTLTVLTRLLPLPLAPGELVVEALLLWLMVFASARWAPTRPGLLGGLPAGLAMVVILFRSTEEIAPTTAVAAGAVWALGPISAAAGGLYLRYLQDARDRAVTAAARAQRLHLARDLHDYVAHDLSEMIAQAQVGQLAEVPSETRLTLQQIEESGLRAMAVMDRTVRMLHDDHSGDAAGTRAPVGIDDLPELVHRFATASAARVQLAVSPDVAAAASRELAGTVHRIVVEALTNIRRHAPAATEIRVDVRRAGDTVEVSVINDASAAPAADVGQRGGLGIAGLTERVSAFGGKLTAGPHGSGWRLLAALPLTDEGLAA